MEYIVNGKKLVWDYDDTSNIDASRLMVDNLYIDHIWNMKDVLRRMWLTMMVFHQVLCQKWLVQTQLHLKLSLILPIRIQIK